MDVVIGIREGVATFVSFPLDVTTMTCRYAMMDRKTEEFLCGLRSPLDLCWPDECPAFTGPWGTWRSDIGGILDL